MWGTAGWKFILIFFTLFLLMFIIAYHVSQVKRKELPGQKSKSYD